MADVDPRTAADLPDAFLLDVREPVEWIAGHAPGAVHIPMAELGSRQQELPAERTIVAICRSGMRSAAVVEALTRAGYDAHNLVGGMHEWAAEGLPVVRDDGAPGVVA
ncbi:rhodanese-like domain-containing protein [Egicoccus halophilus]|uniref:Sulfurtransferase n=1 Tax=Egicoccus halophilus TaxID=1670830 RepID=A0A8J3EVC3_9ACTN|nr:rhodanese-like domain-containing protein [Egicoccus halophilus]GGI07834.1 sulfurtransferase [Egicoccus halophilus]